MVEVTVIVPTYLDASTLSDSIDSVLNQTYSDFELIIVDDCSPDSTPQVVTNYSDPRITYVRHGENRGGSAARNTGIKMANGKYIAFIDSDDLWKSSKLDKQVSAIEALPDDWIAVYCETEYSGEGLLSRAIELYKDITGTGRGYEGDEELIEKLLMAEAHVAAGSSLLAKTEHVRRIGGFDEEFVRHQDWEFLIRLLDHGKCAYLDKKLVVKDTSGRTSPDKRLAAKRMFIEKFSEQIDRCSMSRQDVVDRHMYLAAVFYLEHGRFREGYELLPEPGYFGAKEWLKIGMSTYRGLLNRGFSGFLRDV
jgi:glycosyltransferase involved in cell wall biosynthesis